MTATKYELYRINELVATYYEWLDAHKALLATCTPENTGIPHYVAINGTPKWGNTPEQQADPGMQRKWRAQRAAYMKKHIAKEGGNS